MENLTPNVTSNKKYTGFRNVLVLRKPKKREKREGERSEPSELFRFLRTDVQERLEEGERSEPSELLRFAKFATFCNDCQLLMKKRDLI